MEKGWGGGVERGNNWADLASVNKRAVCQDGELRGCFASSDSAVLQGIHTLHCCHLKWCGEDSLRHGR